MVTTIFCKFRPLIKTYRFADGTDRDAIIYGEEFDALWPNIKTLHWNWTNENHLTEQLLEITGDQKLIDAFINQPLRDGKSPVTVLTEAKAEACFGVYEDARLSRHPGIIGNPGVVSEALTHHKIQAAIIASDAPQELKDYLDITKPKGFTEPTRRKFRE